MVQNVSIPLSWSNNIPGVSGVDDVTFDIPEVPDINSPILDAIPDPTDLQTAAEEGVVAAFEDTQPFDELSEVVVDRVVDELDPLLDDLAADLEAEFANVVDQIDFGALSDIEVDIEGSLFALESDFVDLLAAALDQADLGAVSQFPDLDSILEPLEDAQGQLEELEVPTIEDIQDALEAALMAVLEELPGGTLLTDPEQFIDDQIARIADRLVSDETREAAEDFAP